MKIKRFNENFNFRMNEDVDHAYIRHCFADFIDEPQYLKGANVTIDGNAFMMTIPLPVNLTKAKLAGTSFGNDFEYISDNDNTMRKFIAGFDLNNEFYKEIGLAFDRLTEEYPDLRMKMLPGDETVYIMITRG